MLSVSTESVNMDLEMGRNTPCYVITSALLHQNGLSKHGADKPAADKSQGSHSGRGQINPYYRLHLNKNRNP